MATTAHKVCVCVGGGMATTAHKVCVCVCPQGGGGGYGYYCPQGEGGYGYYCPQGEGGMAATAHIEMGYATTTH